MAKSIENSIDFAAKRQVWQQMIVKIIRPMLIAMSIWQTAMLFCCAAKLRGEKLFRFPPLYNHYTTAGQTLQSQKSPEHGAKSLLKGRLILSVVPLGGQQKERVLCPQAQQQLFQRALRLRRL